jgi:hypothetical protein
MGGSPMSSGKVQFTKKTYLIIAIIAIIIVAVVITTASQDPQSKKGQVAGQVTVTIEKDIGVEYITVNNLDVATGDFRIAFIDLPYSFNCSTGDALVISCKAQDGYLWNGWRFSTGHFKTANPLTLTSEDEEYALKDSIIIRPCLMYLNPTATPTPTPTPTISPSPSPTPQHT